MNNTTYYYIMTFSTTTEVIQAESYAKGKLPTTIMPLPREIQSGCGLALRFMESEKENILTFCKNAPFSGQLYKFETRRVNGYHPIERIPF